MSTILLSRMRRVAGWLMTTIQRQVRALSAPEDATWPILRDYPYGRAR
jgi:hypothetical protein